MDALININLYSTFIMLGVIWVVQLSHYPAFRYVDEKDFKEFSRMHMTTISFIVVPTIILEMFSTFSLSYLFKESIYYHINSILMLMIISSTYFLSVPCHNKLIYGKDMRIINRLVNTNWIRTICWTVKALVLIKSQTL